MWRKLPLIWKILIGMMLGICWGMIAILIGWEKFTTDWIKPWGTIFINLLKLIAVPLIFVSLVKAVSGISDIAKLSRIGLKTISIYILTTVFAVFVGLTLVNIIKPGNTFPEEKKEVYLEKFKDPLKDIEQEASERKEGSPLQYIVDMVPDNIFKATTENAKMLQVIFFAVIFGIAMVLIPGKKVSFVKNFFDGLNDIILKLVDMIMIVAPYGVFALLAALVVDFGGDVDLFTALGLYSITVLVGLFTMILIVYPILVRVFAGIKIKDFFRGILPAQMVAFSTSSSAATLPVTKEQVENELGVHEEIASFVLPIGVTVNMDGTSCYQAIAAVFIAQVFGIDLDLTAQLTIVLTATLASIGAPGIPSGSIVMLSIVLLAANLPSIGIALVFGIDRPLDMVRTIVNITGDSTVSAIVAKSEGELNYPVKRKETA